MRFIYLAVMLALLSTTTVAGAQHLSGAPANYTVTDLGALEANGSSFATAVNTRGQVVGYDAGTDGLQHAFLYSNGMIQNLGIPGNGNNSVANGLNDLGQVVGLSGATTTYAGITHAFVYDRGTLMDLGTLNGSGYSSVATGINDAGQVVGGSYSSLDGGYHAFLYTRNRGMIDLGTLGGSFTGIHVIEE